MPCSNEHSQMTNAERLTQTIPKVPACSQSGFHTILRISDANTRLWALPVAASSARIRIVRMVDIHCHMLPAVDDGARTWEMAEEMARIAHEDGITHIVCTPHANDQYPYDRTAHEARLEELRERSGRKVEFSLGSDFHFSFENIREALQDPHKFAISGTGYLLVEFSDYAISPATGDALLRFIQMGITPIITHPERNLILQRKPESVLQFAEYGCVVQVTANSLTGAWGEGPRKVAKWLLDRNAVHVLATDAHDTRHRPPILSKAREVVSAAYGQEVAEALVLSNPRAVILDEELPYRPGLSPHK